MGAKYSDAWDLWRTVRSNHHSYLPREFMASAFSWLFPCVVGSSIEYQHLIEHLAFHLHVGLFFLFLLLWSVPWQKQPKEERTGSQFESVVHLGKDVVGARAWGSWSLTSVSGNSIACAGALWAFSFLCSAGHKLREGWCPLFGHSSHLS